MAFCDILHSTFNDAGGNWSNASSALSSGDYGTPGAENDSCVLTF